MRLNPRLALAAEMCAGAGRLIEVGCDHAQLSACVVLHGAQSALACDLRAKPLARAAETVREHGLQSKIELRLSDGLLSVEPREGDTIAICGMGGELIAAILERSPWALEGAHTLVLQPQSRGRYLRRFLAGRGCGVTREALARDGGRLYCVMRARGGEKPLGEEQMYMFTEKLTGDALFPEFAREQRDRLRKVIAGRERGGLGADEDMKMLKILESYIIP